MLRILETKLLKVHAYRLGDAYSTEEEEKFFNSLPDNIKTRINKYKYPTEKRLRIMGKIILRELLLENGFEKLSNLEDLKYTDKNKPYLPGVEFSIAHSYDIVICALNLNGKVGIDIEKEGSIEIGDIEDQLTEDEKKKGVDDAKQLYKLWTRKEALAKATGEGIEFHFNLVSVLNDVVEYQLNTFEFIPLSVDINYHASLCISKEV